ncbi:ABC transporter permease [Caproiciproducens sp. CPB-2]|uniref:ABC transporter permease n=1 Tax=unclassified Caproiciproducens TaxID=2643836 RepID=UPI0023DC4D56|nr:ABC transporter permease [Caproiciproducens sp. CPB-2]MDF1496362.1 ABC transporter permease [Caproiciproducens sp. CPB-2]
MGNTNHPESAALKGGAAGSVAVNWLRRNLAAIAAVLGLCIALSITTNTFLVSTNLLSLLRQSCVNVLIAFGITCVLICGGIDLSVGSCAAASGVITVRLANAGLPLVVCILTALVFGALLGLFNGYVISHTTIPAFIVTLSTQIIVRGVGYVVTGGQPTQCTNETFNLIGTGDLFGIPTPVFVVAFVFIVLFFIMNRTGFGRHVYATGGNAEAAKYAGVNTKSVQMRVFMMSGILAALAGVVLAARLYSGQPSVGEGFERDAIAASVLGGTSFNGGVGTLGGTVIGALIIGVLNNGMNLLRINSYWQFVVRGCVILGAVYIDFLKKARTLKK